ncbi:hypothetical protein D9M68_103530 [compost metagenome]
MTTIKHCFPRKQALIVPIVMALVLGATWASAESNIVSQQRVVTEKGWTGAFAQKSEKSFGMTFADDVVLHASALSQPVVGREHVQAVMSTASKLYEKLEFVDQASNGRRTWLEWKAVALGGKEFSGVTVLTRNDKGEIVEASIHHRPRWAAMMFGDELHKRLPGVITSEYVAALDRR